MQCGVWGRQLGRWAWLCPWQLSHRVSFFLSLTLAFLIRKWDGKSTALSWGPNSWGAAWCLACRESSREKSSPGTAVGSDVKASSPPAFLFSSYTHFRISFFKWLSVKNRSHFVLPWSLYRRPVPAGVVALPMSSRLNRKTSLEQQAISLTFRRQTPPDIYVSEQIQHTEGLPSKCTSPNSHGIFIKPEPVTVTLGSDFSSSHGGG